MTENSSQVVLIDPQMPLRRKMATHSHNFSLISDEITLDTLDQYQSFCKNMINDITGRMNEIDRKLHAEREDEYERMKKKLAKLTALLNE